MSLPEKSKACRRSGRAAPPRNLLTIQHKHCETEIQLTHLLKRHRNACVCVIWQDLFVWNICCGVRHFVLDSVCFYSHTKMILYRAVLREKPVGLDNSQDRIQVTIWSPVRSLKQQECCGCSWCKLLAVEDQPFVILVFYIGYCTVCVGLIR